MIVSKHRRHTIWCREWYHKKRLWLIEQLGGKCVKCGSAEDLEFGHFPKGRTWSMRLGRRQRMRKYLQEHQQGLLRLLCASGNGRQGKPDAEDSFNVEELEKM